MAVESVKQKSDMEARVQMKLQYLRILRALANKKGNFRMRGNVEVTGDIRMIDPYLNCAITDSKAREKGYGTRLRSSKVVSLSVKM